MIVAKEQAVKQLSYSYIIIIDKDYTEFNKYYEY